MKATGIVRKIDDLGRVVIPKELRKTFDITAGDSLEIFTDSKGEVIFRKYQPGCVICGSVDYLVSTIQGKHICISCARVIAGRAV